MLLLALLFAGNSDSQTHPASLEYEVKAAFLLNFTKFIEWPAAEPGTAEGPFNICLAGDDPFGSVLEQTIQGEKVNGQLLVIQRVGHTPTKGCRIVYIDRGEKDVKELLGTLGPGVLTVGEGENFL